MTDTLSGIGPVTTDNPPASTGPDGKGSSPPPAAQPPGQPQADNLDWAKAKGWLADDGTLKADKASDVLKSYRSLEQWKGTVKAVPGEEAKPEDWDRFHKDMGWPGSAEKYEFTRPDNLPENLPYDEGLATWFKQTANEQKLPVKAAQAIHDSFAAKQAADVAAFEAELTTRARAAHETLVKGWGEPNSETYLKNRDAAQRALRSDPNLAGFEVELMKAGLLTRDGNFTSPQIAILLSGYGRQMQNDSLQGGGKGSSTGTNPFDKASENLSQQAMLIRSDPSRARALAQAAGWTQDQMRFFPGA